MADNFKSYMICQVWKEINLHPTIQIISRITEIPKNITRSYTNRQEAEENEFYERINFK